MATEAHDLKEARLDIRLTSRQKAEFEAVAQEQSRSLTSFVVETVAAEVARRRSEQTSFMVDAERWNLFTQALDRPAMEKPRLRALLTEASVFEDAP